MNEKPNNIVPLKWETINLKNLAGNELNSFTDGDWIESPYIKDHGIRLVQTGNIGDGFFRNENKKYISEADFKKLKCKEILSGDVLICRLADPIGRACILPPLNNKAITSVDVTIFRPDKQKVNRYFIKEAINFPPTRNKILSVSGGSTRQRINRSNLGNIEILLPPLSEQQKIADILSTFDEKIDVIDAQIAKTQELKKGLMHELLTRGIGNKKLRASPLGEIPESWQVVKLGNLGKLIGGVAFKANEFNNDGLGFQVIRMSNIQPYGLELSKNPVFIHSISAKEEKFILKEGDLLITLTGTIGKTDYGNVAYIEEPGKMVLNQRVGRFEYNKEVVGRFLFYVFNSSSFNKQFFERGKGGTGNQANVGKEGFETITICLPPRHEQEKIAAILFSVDQKINVLHNKKSLLSG